MSDHNLKSCPICNSNFMVIASVPTINPACKDLIDLMECSKCGHWFHIFNSTQQKLNEMYNSASPFVVSAGAKEGYRKKNTKDSFHEYVLKRISKKSGNYLEIGAGGGGLLRQFRGMNFTCYGVDPGQWVKDGSIVYSIDDLPKDLKYDVFILQDVLEHILDPVGLMTRLKKMARGGSVFFCSFPCNDSRPARVYKGRWVMVRPYGHLHYFSFDSTTKMLSRAGLKVKDIRLERVTAIFRTLRSLNIRVLLYEILKGGRDQIYLTATVTIDR